MQDQILQKNDSDDNGIDRCNQNMKQLNTQEDLKVTKKEIKKLNNDPAKCSRYQPLDNEITGSNLRILNQFKESTLMQKNKKESNASLNEQLDKEKASTSKQQDLK